jgi:hypothetical protein
MNKKEFLLSNSTSETFTNCVNELSRAKTILEWNAIRKPYVDVLTPQEMATIESSGLIVEVLGS